MRGSLREASKSDLDVEQVLDKEQTVFASISAKARQYSQEAWSWLHHLDFVYDMVASRRVERPSSVDNPIVGLSHQQMPGEAQRYASTAVARKNIDEDNTRVFDADTNTNSHPCLRVEGKAKSEDVLPITQHLSSNTETLRELDRDSHHDRLSQREADSSVHSHFTESRESPANPAISPDLSIGKNGSLSPSGFNNSVNAAMHRDVDAPILTPPMTDDSDLRQQKLPSHEDQPIFAQPDSAILSALQLPPDPWARYSPTLAPVRLAAIEKSAPLHYAAYMGKLEAMRALLYIRHEHDQSVSPNARFDQDTPIIYATRAGQAAAVEVLLAAGADPSIRGIGGLSSHHWAVICSHKEIYTLLEKHSLPHYNIDICGKIDDLTYTFDGWGLVSLAAYFCSAAVFHAVYTRWLSDPVPYPNAKRKVLLPAVASLPYLILTWVASSPGASESWRKTRYDPLWLCKAPIVLSLPGRLWCENEIEMCKTRTSSDRLSIVTSVLSTVVDIEKKDAFGYTTLQAACCGASTAIVEKLLRHGANPYWKYYTPAPIPQPKPKKSGLRLFSGSTPSTPSISTTIPNYALNVSPLHLAAFWGRHAIIDLLIREGADPNVVAYGRTRPLHFAAAMGNTKAVKTLLSFNADVDVGTCTGHFCLYFQCEEVRHTPLSLAVEGNHLEAMTALIQGGADVKKQIYDANPSRHFNRELKEDILCRAIRTKASIEAIEMLLNNGADVNSFAKNLDSPLNLAIKLHSGLQMIELLLSRKPDPNWLDSQGQPALHLAIEAGSSTGDICAVVKALLNAGANPHLSYASGFTAIDRCTQMISSIQTDKKRDADWSRRHPIKDYIAVAQMLYDR